MEKKLLLLAAYASRVCRGYDSSFFFLGVWFIRIVRLVWHSLVPSSLVRLLFVGTCALIILCEESFARDPLSMVSRCCVLPAGSKVSDPLPLAHSAPGSVLALGAAIGHSKVFLFLFALFLSAPNP